MPPTLPQVGVPSPAEANQRPHARLAAIADAIRELTDEQSRILQSLHKALVEIPEKDPRTVVPFPAEVVTVGEVSDAK